MTETKLGKEVVCQCPDCEFELEVIFFNPQDEEEIKKIKKIAGDRGPKAGKERLPYDVSKLDFTQNPIVIPSPKEEEDWGE